MCVSVSGTIAVSLRQQLSKVKLYTSSCSITTSEVFKRMVVLIDQPASTDRFSSLNLLV